MGVEAEDIADAEESQREQAPARIRLPWFRGLLPEKMGVIDQSEAGQERQEEEKAIGARFLAVIHMRAPYREQRRREQPAGGPKSQPAEQIHEADGHHARDHRDRTNDL